MDLIKIFLSRQQNKSRRKILKLADIRREYSSKADYDESRLFYHKNKKTSSSDLWYQERQLNDEDPQLREARAEWYGAREIIRVLKSHKWILMNPFVSSEASWVGLASDRILRAELLK